MMNSAANGVENTGNEVLHGLIEEYTLFVRIKMQVLALVPVKTGPSYSV